MPKARKPAPSPASPLTPQEARLARAWIDREKREREWSLFAGEVLDPDFSDREQRDEELFNDVEHPAGLLQLHAWRGVTAHVDVDRANVTAAIAGNVKGCAPLALTLEGNGLHGEDGQRIKLRVTPAGLIALATVLPRVVELARRDGLLEPAGSGTPS